MKVRLALRAADITESMASYRDALRSHQRAINSLNVYPVPDGDTGTNMALTLESVVGELESVEDPNCMAEVCAAVAHGSLMGARGNSGVILSQLLRGVADRLATAQEVGPADLAESLILASELADKAVVRPVEGTILTVARAAGTAAGQAAERGMALLEVVETARTAAAQTLSKTPELLDVLKRAGVVDAGGSGYLLFFDALLTTMDARPLPTPPLPGEPHGSSCDGLEKGVFEAHGTPVSKLRYEVMYLLDAPDDAIDDFKEVWAGIGDSIVVVGGDGLWNCHIHTDDIGEAIEAALDTGRPHRIRVTDLEEQMEEERWVRDNARDSGHAGSTPEWKGPVPTTGVVAVVVGEGIGRIFRSLGVHSQVGGGQSMNPSTADVLEAVNATGSDRVVVLPNNSNIRPVAEQVDAMTEKSVRVVPTGSIVEGFAALLAYDPGADLEENVSSMTASAARVVPCEITRAVRNAVTSIGEVREGEWIGVSRGEVVAIDETAVAAACKALGSLIAAEHELITIIEGDGSEPGDTRRITEWLHDEHPEIEVEVHHGGQPLYPYLFGIE